jgi:MFS-type transporter involved in bile tolerance (Atg22 family)
MLALTTSHKVGLLVFAIIFVVFALLSAVVIPRFRPNFPGRALPLFLVACVVLFIAMFTAVLIFGAETEEEGHGGSAAAHHHK